MSTTIAAIAPLQVGLAWGLLLWLLLAFLQWVPEPMLEKVLLVGAVLLAVMASAAVKRYSTMLVAGVGGLLAFALLKYAVQPVLPLLLLLTVLGLYGALVFRFGRLVLVYLTAGLLALTLAEAYWTMRLAAAEVEGLGQQHRVQMRDATLTVAAIADADLGFRYQANASITETKTWRGQPIFTATYTTNAQGWRQTPPFPGATAAAPVLFLGCSFVFGQGVADDETLVAAFVRAGAGRWQGYNLSVPGYGAHQNLRILEQKIEQESLAGSRPVAGIYVAVADHVPRAAGLRFWDQGGPRYEVTADGLAVYQGRLNAGLGGKLREFIMHSALARRLVGYFEGTLAQEQRYLAVVRRMAQVFEARYQAPFYVFYWGDEARPAEQARLVALKQAGLRVYSLRQAIPDYDPARDVYPHDGHPTPAAQARVGNFLAARLQAEWAASDRPAP